MMKLKVCKTEIEVSEERISEFLAFNKYYIVGPDEDSANTFESAKASRLHQNFMMLEETDEYVLLAAKYNTGFKMILFDLMPKRLHGMLKPYQENTEMLEEFSDYFNM